MFAQANEGFPGTRSTYCLAAVIFPEDMTTMLQAKGICRRFAGNLDNDIGGPSLMIVNTYMGRYLEQQYAVYLGGTVASEVALCTFLYGSTYSISARK